MKNKLTTFLLGLVFCIGLSVLLYPSVSNYWNSRTQSKVLDDYKSQVSNLTSVDYESYFAAADQYNSDLRMLPYPMLNHDQVPGYFDLLDVTESGVMGYIEIDKINVELPIHHGTSSKVLNMAVGHMEGTSLPCGGPGTHCVLSAHRGLPSAKLFTNLDKLEIGDVFTLSVLDRVLTYEVDQIEIVEPIDTKSLGIEDGKDYCTLVTCTPYGINTHRLLVRGKRVETIDKKVIHVTPDAYRIDKLIVTPFVAIPLLMIVLPVVIFKPTKKDRNREDHQ